MHSPLKLCAAALASVFALAACSSEPAVPMEQPSNEITHIATVDASASVSQAALEDMYGAEAIVYKPDAGFAVLGFTKAQSELTSLNTEPNAEVSAPVHASSVWGSSVWGSSVWGSSVWGSSVWGSSVWGSGVWGSGSSLPAESTASLDLIGITAGHAAASNFGSGITVAVIDTGLDLDHTMFTGHLAPAADWKDYIDGDLNPEDDPVSSTENGALFGHGTAVAGLILQVAPNAKILPIRALSAGGTGEVDDIITAIDHAISKGADVINLSLGTNENLVSFSTMINYASTQGVHVIVATGNAGNSSIDYPAAYANSATNEDYIISVGSSSALDVRSVFTNYDSNLEFLAPGEHVFSAYPGDLAGTHSGTSFSTPIVAGLVALGLGEVTGTPAMEDYLISASDAVTGIYNGSGIPQADDLMAVLP